VTRVDILSRIVFHIDGEILGVVVFDYGMDGSAAVYCGGREYSWKECVVFGRGISLGIIFIARSGKDDDVGISKNIGTYTVT
jgi:hypothetical protein